ncbi:carboxypeptidase regulatory-like domain-containing protein [Anoxybacterium hadale]|uniref:Carboxypeptidase regulatory-like domain-containing protein n=1 Tax=Anoxybacterium hadale TaxID=3408580 RepID=A0ACD1A9B9_9FIRM|nr:carboxypeptidase regulatory-like domain-containing protein [Clostridiales bacterium]
MNGIRNAGITLLVLLLVFTSSLCQSFAASAAPAPVVTISGSTVVSGTVYTAAVKPNWTQSSSYQYAFSLKRSDTQGGTQTTVSSFTRNSSVSSDGYYTLTVTASRSGYTSTTTTVTFVIDKVYPAAPAVSAVTNGSTYTSSITPLWDEVPGTTITAKLDGSPYIKGTTINTVGSHTLVVTATKNSNQLTASTTIGFKIDYSNGDWASKKVVLKNTPEADLMVRIGDVDNFGFGWTSTSPTFDPFSGNSTKVHSFPWTQPSDEPNGLDKIMIVSGYKYSSSVPTDGYTSDTKGKDNALEEITLDYADALSGITVHNAVLQLFVDDFQPAGAKGIGNGSGKVQYQVKLNGTRVSDFERMINTMDQSGPIGKLITLEVPAQNLAELKTGKLILKLDDPVTGGADGYAIDFVKLLINLKTADYRGTITGTVTDRNTGDPISGAAITLEGRKDSAVTNSNGKYTISDVTAGQVTITAYMDGYETKNLNNIDVKAGNTATVNIELNPNDTNAPDISLDKDITVWTTRNVKVTATVTDESGVAVIKYAKGTLPKSYFDKGESNDITSTSAFSVDYGGRGFYTVYAKDINNNASVKTIEVNNFYQFGGTSIQVTPQTEDTNGRFHVTLRHTESSRSVLEYSLSGDAWLEYNGPFEMNRGTTVYTREADYSKDGDPVYRNGGSRTILYVISAGALNTLSNGSTATLSLLVNSADLDASSLESASSYITFTGLNDAVTIKLVEVQSSGGDSYQLNFKVEAFKAGFNGVIGVTVSNVSTIAVPLKIQTVSTKGIM